MFVKLNLRVGGVEVKCIKTLSLSTAFFEILFLFLNLFTSKTFITFILIGFS